MVGVADPAAHLSEARRAIAVVGPRFARLVRDSPHDVPAVGRWSVGDVARHVSHVIRVDTDALAEHPLPIAELRPAVVAAGNAEFLADDPERDPGKLADRIEALLEEFFRVVDRPLPTHVTWVGGVSLPSSAVACHLLEELLVHGFDIASGAKQRWTIESNHAGLALVGAAAPIVNAADRSAFTDLARAGDLAAHLDVRLRGHARLTFAFERGLRVTDPATTPVDAHVSIDPAPALLLMLGRIGVVRAAVTGRILVWGRRPWVLPRMLRAITPP